MIETATLVTTGLSALRHLLVKYVDSEIEKRILTAVSVTVNDKMKDFVDGIKKRTILYIVFGVVCIILPYICREFSLPRGVLGLVALSILIVLGYFALMTLVQIRSAVHFLENFETLIDSELRKEYQKATSSSMSSQIASMLSSKNISQYVPLVAFGLISNLGSWLKANKSIFVYRLIAYFLASYALGDCVSILWKN